VSRDLEQRAAAARGQAVEKQDEEPTLHQLLTGMQDQFAAAMPQGMEAKQLVRDVYTCISQNPNLGRAVPNTVLGAAMTCAQLGLRPGVLGHAWILPYWDGKDRVYKAQLILGYQGLVDLAYRSGLVKDIASRIVYEKDEFRVEWNADGDKLIHRPYLDGDPGEPRLYYAVARTTAGGYWFTRPMTVADMQAHRDKHAPRNKDRKIVGPWVSDFDGMGLKTVIRKLMKLLPKSTAVGHALAHDEGVRYDPAPAAINVEPEFVEHGAGPGTEAESPATEPEAVDGEVVDAEVETPVTDDTETGESAPDQAATRAQQNAVKKLLAAEMIDTAQQGEWLSVNVGRDVAAVKNLTYGEAAQLLAEYNQEGK
jgi:recombination protein RecT